MPKELLRSTVNLQLAHVQDGNLQAICTFLTSNFFLPSTLLVLEPSAFLATGASLISTSAMVGRYTKSKSRFDVGYYMEFVGCEIILVTG
jgi:hypothetical protein